MEGGRGRGGRVVLVVVVVVVESVEQSSVNINSASDFGS